MAYTAMGRPRFYCDSLTWALSEKKHALGALGQIDPLITHQMFLNNELWKMLCS